MTDETYAFINDLFETYYQSSDGKEPANAAVLERAWEEIDDIRATARTMRRIIAGI